MPNSRGSRWLAWLFAGAALASMLVLSIVLRIQENEDKVWPVTTAVAARLATDDGARDLYAKNPGLAVYYGSADAFVEAARQGRTAIGALPAREPHQSAKTYDRDFDPMGFRAAVKGDGGGWLALEVQRSNGSAAGHAAIGEGVVYAGFAAASATPRGLWEAARAQREARLWEKFRSVARALMTEDGTRRLLQEQPSLIPAKGGVEAFLAQASAWRPRLAGSPPPAAFEDAKDGLRFLLRDGPGLDRAELAWKLKDGGRLQVRWDNSALVKVAVEDQ